MNHRNKRPQSGRSSAQRLERGRPKRPDRIWSMDIVAVHAIKGGDAAAYPIEIFQTESACPETIQVDNGSEFISKDMDRWACKNKG